MIKSNKPSIWISLVAASTFLLGGVVTSGLFLQSRSAANPTIHYAEASWTHDFSKDVTIAEQIPHIYVAKVVSKTTQYGLWAAASDDTPTTVYTMKITEILQGSDLTSGAYITVSQYGGLTNDSKELLLIEGDSLLKERRDYMIASTPSRDGEVETLLNSFGHTDLTSLPKGESKNEVTSMRKAIEASR